MSVIFCIIPRCSLYEAYKSMLVFEHFISFQLMCQPNFIVRRSIIFCYFLFFFTGHDTVCGTEHTEEYSGNREHDPGNIP